ncbi:MAG: ABC transporter permease [Porticoccaceae bacterium]|jgi:ABC-type multidrug transport system permease subunit|nr:ABC transporter permease [Porticoccaceae bacterium]HLS98273.1 ABC transporter permease [Porticoccaceae bacterium]
MKQFLAILVARNKEYYRDKGSVAWAFLFPLLVIVACALAFSNPDTSVFRVGLHGDFSAGPADGFLRQPYIKAVPFAQLDRALERTQHHQLDLLLSSDGGLRYWINTESSASAAAEQLLLATTGAFAREEISGRKIRYVDWVIPGVLGMNLMFGALFGVGYVIVRYRHNGVLKRLQATPVTALQFLAAQMVSRLLIVVTVNGLIFVGCALFLDLIVLGSYLNLLLITLMGALAMIALGLLVASRTANEELAGGLLNVATWPMLLMSEVWFTLDDAPGWMQSLSGFLPLTHIVKAFRAVMIEGASLVEVGHHLLWLTAMTAVALGLAALLFRWHRR